MRRARHRDGRPLAVPAGLALATGIGLFAGLLGDGMWDAIAAVGLAMPVAAIAAGLLRAGG